MKNFSVSSFESLWFSGLFLPHMREERKEGRGKEDGEEDKRREEMVNLRREACEDIRGVARNEGGGNYIEKALQKKVGVGCGRSHGAWFE